jgi:5-methylcytosine-specific restriction endonuclease McrA
MEIDLGYLRKAAKALETIGSYCFYCGKKCSGDSVVEHMVPISRGGGDANNIVISCQSCNVSKGARTVEEYRRKIAAINMAESHRVVFAGETSVFVERENAALEVLRQNPYT